MGTSFRPRGRIKTTPEDFVVEEIPAYEPCGAGEHVFVRFTKRNLTTHEAALRIARAVGVPFREVGIAGLKDKVAVTTQTISLPVPPKPAGGDALGGSGSGGLEAVVQALALDGITVQGVTRHKNKLRTGHLAGNRFAVVVRGIDPAHADDVIATLVGVGRDGMPNAFGSQRFGRDRDNADRARVWLSGRASAPRDRRLGKLLFSALQSELFNRVLSARVADGTWATPLPGDLVKRRTAPALFPWTGETREEDKVDPPSPTGPMFGVKMRQPEGAPGALERAILAECLGAGVDLSAARAYGEGTRRSLRLWVDDLRIERLDDGQVAGAGGESGVGLKFYFVLPKGGYATSVLGTALALESVGEGTTDPLASTPGGTHEVSQRPAGHSDDLESEES